MDKSKEEDVNGLMPSLPVVLKQNLKKKKLSKRYLKSRWKHYLSQDKNGVLLIEGLSVNDLQKKYGTPIFVLIEEELRKKVREFIYAFDYFPFTMRYACKCNSNLEVLRIIREEGAELDASSPGEIILGLLADFLPSQITFTNLYKTKQDILFAASVGVYSITLDSLEELDKAIEVSEKLKKEIAIILRVNPMISDGRYTTSHQQYGIPQPYIKKALIKIKSSPYLKLKGYHFHGSYAHNQNSYYIAAKKLLGLIKVAEGLGLKIEDIDLGGGFPVEAPKALRPGKYFTFKEFGDKFVPFFKDECRKAGFGNIKLVFEPGKSIVANAGIALIKVISKKKLSKKEILITDSSCYSMLPDILVSKCIYEALPASKMNSPRTHVYDLAGCTCDCIDIIKRKE
jgi:diaminopimelate decarboxylase